EAEAGGPPETRDAERARGARRAADEGAGAGLGTAAMTRVVALGTADAFSSGARGNTAWLIEDGAPLCAIDFGPTAVVAMRRAGRDPQELRAIHFTHLHGDHIGGWAFLLVVAAYRAPPTTVSPSSRPARRCYAPTVQNCERRQRVPPVLRPTTPPKRAAATSPGTTCARCCRRCASARSLWVISVRRRERPRHRSRRKRTPSVSTCACATISTRSSCPRDGRRCSRRAVRVLTNANGPGNAAQEVHRRATARAV